MPDGGCLFVTRAPLERDFAKILAIRPDFAPGAKTSLTAMINTPFQAPLPTPSGAKGSGGARRRRWDRRDAFPPVFFLANE